MTNRRPNKTGRWISNVLLIAGTIALGVWAFSFFGQKLWQKYQNRVFEANRSAQSAGDSNQTNPAPPAAPLPRLKEGAIVGRLSIPRLGVKAMIREGDDNRTLSLALGHIPGTAFPGQRGNVGVAGHRDTLFRGLRHIAANDRITVDTTNSSYVYQVESMQIVKPENVSVLNPGPGPELTLVTCYPFSYVGSAPDRFIVKARLLMQNEAENRLPEERRSAENNRVPRPKRLPDDRDLLEDKQAVTPAAVHPSLAPPSPGGEIAFSVAPGHSRELVAGKIWFGLSSADPENRSVDGWIWVMPDRQTIWLKDVDARHPVTLHQDGGTRELVITSVARNSASGYLVSLHGQS